MGKCLFCDHECTEVQNNGAVSISDCPNCGLFSISYSYASTLTNALKNCHADKKHLIAGYLYEFNKDSQEPYDFMSGSLENLLNDARIPRTPMQRLERFLLNLYKVDDTIGKMTRINHGRVVRVKERTPCFLSLSYAKNESELIGMFDGLADLGYMIKIRHTDSMYDYYISPKGFERAEQLLSTNIDSRTAFIAMGFHDDLLEACEKAIKPACDKCGFEALLISDKPHNNGITDEIMAEIKRSKFVIVDFTYNNNGAYFEAGYAQGLGRPVIRCCKKEWFDTDGNNLHFDTRHYNTILWKSHDDLYEQLKNNIIVNIDGAILNKA